jgi:tetratricopeptide (TPR) repeat protein
MNPNFSESERLEAGIQEYEQILQSEPDNWKAWHIRGHLLARLERFEEAIASYDKALAIKADDDASWYERGDVLSYLRRYEAAIASYDRAFELGHNDAETWYMRGQACCAIRDLESALDSYEKACTLQPENGAIWYAKGYTFLQLNRYGQARISFNRATQCAPDSAYAWYFYGETLEKTGNLQAALDSFNQALELEENSFFLIDRGRILRQLGDYVAALASYDRALELNPNCEIAWLNRGAVLCDYLGRSQEALTCFERAIAIAPDNYLAWYNQGNALRKLKQYEAAIASYEKAIELKPDYNCAQYERDWLLCLIAYKQQKKFSYDTALKLVSQTVDLFLDHSQYDEEQISEFLANRGIQETHVDDLVVFIPMAFGRAYLLDKVAAPPATFVWIHPDTEQRHEVILSDQPIFQAAYDFAVQWMQEKGQDQEFMYLARWSAEVDVIHKVLDAGRQLENLELSPCMAYSTCKPIEDQPLSEEQQASPAAKVITVCPNCAQKLRAPVNRGNLKLTCPKCRYVWLWSPTSVVTEQIE